MLYNKNVAINHCNVFVKPLFFLDKLLGIKVFKLEDEYTNFDIYLIVCAKNMYFNFAS